MHSSRTYFVVTTLAMALALGNISLAQSLNRQVGTQFTVTADPLVPRPSEQPCKVQLFSDYQFAFFSESAQTFQYLRLPPIVRGHGQRSSSKPISARTRASNSTGPPASTWPTPIFISEPLRSRWPRSPTPGTWSAT